MDVKTVSLNDKLFEEVYTSQPEGFVQKRKEHLAYKLKRSLNVLK